MGFINQLITGGPHIVSHLGSFCTHQRDVGDGASLTHFMGTKSPAAKPGEASLPLAGRRRHWGIVLPLARAGRKNQKLFRFTRPGKLYITI